MNKYRDYLLELLKNFPPAAITESLRIYPAIAGQIVLQIEDKLHSGTVPEKASDTEVHHVSIAILKGNVSYSCDCQQSKDLGYCNHVVLLALKALTSAYLMSFGHVQLLLTVGNANFPKPETGIKNASAEAAPTANVNLFGEIEEVWKTFSSAAHQAFHTVYGLDYKTVTRDLLKATTLVKLIEDEPHWLFLFKKGKIVFHPQIKYNRYSAFSYTCDCGDTKAICMHVKAAFEFLQQNNDRYYFKQFRNRNEEKNKLLAPYGITLADKEAADFVFVEDYYDNLSVKPPEWLWKDEITDKVNSLRRFLEPEKSGLGGRPIIQNDSLIDFEVGFLFNLQSQHFKVGFELEAIRVFSKNGKETYKKLIIHQAENLAMLRSLPDDLYKALMSITNAGVKTHMLNTGHQSMYYYANPYGQMTAAAQEELKKYLMGQIIEMWPLLSLQPNTYLLETGSFSAANIKPARLSAERLTFFFEVTVEERHIAIALFLEKNGKTIFSDNITVYHDFLFNIDGMLHVPASKDDLDMLVQFAHGFVKIPISGKVQVIKNMIPLLQKKYRVVVAKELQAEYDAPVPGFQVLLREMDGKFLLLQPQYTYNDVVVNYEPQPDNIFQELPEGGYKIIERNINEEKLFFDSLRVLHPKFQKPTQNNFFFLPFDETMKQNWFVNAIRQLNDSNITVLGMADLQKHRYSTHQAKWEMKAGSGIDWFDLQIEVSFGDQVVALRDVRKALMNKQNIVVLGDGTFGVLPEEWLQQYGMLLKMGDEQKDGSLRVSKLHYTLIDELHSQIDDQAILDEINEKKQRLLQIGKVKPVKPPKQIKATLRPYQVTGFQWFQSLDELGWGGCLADDMGLGKTLQTITFLQYLKAKYAGSTHLVICPTSLIYNWESELQKFAPTLRYHIYYGNERTISEAHFNDYDVIISSYGIIRNDLEELMKFEWHYIILDESQAIKNPEAQTNKALQLMKSRNRMILSGTPVQNNTYDLYAQFNFINPGFLGSREFFKTEFANPIDKSNDAEKSAQLRRLIFPFMLRRTKEQVAPDLPDKTETVLWCEMGKQQRAVYDEYKNYYRQNLMEKIETEGMAKAGIYVLEGLLRLRQICDSPVLVKDNEVTTSESVKIEELMREIAENSGGHKLLVFSQFTEMLHLLEDKLKADSVNYVYLDGSTPAAKRQEAVAAFQGDASVRVFLVSLKAGGVGLNLTAADYVYIVDPWWNPAVEQQAIDRTHRIGQVNKIFAYKMICKDTVEEKIVQLQQKKKQLANELVTEDAGFIKKLTKDDIAFLFS